MSDSEDFIFEDNLLAFGDEEQKDERTRLTPREYEDYCNRIGEMYLLLEQLKNERSEFYFRCKCFVQGLDESKDKWMNVNKHSDFNPSCNITSRFPCLNRWHPIYVKSIIAKLCRLREYVHSNRLRMSFLTLSTAQGDSEFSVKLRMSKTSVEESFGILKAGWDKVRKLLHKYLDNLDYIGVIERMDSSIYPHLHIIVFVAVPLWLQARIKFMWEHEYRLGISTKGCWWGYEDKKKKDRKYVYKKRLVEGDFSREKWSKNNWQLGYKWYSKMKDNGYEFSEGDGFDLTEGDFIADLVNYLVPYISKRLITNGSKFEEKNKFAWTKEDLIFNTIIKENHYRTFFCTRKISGIMKRRDLKCEISDPEFEIEDFNEGLYRDHLRIDDISYSSKDGSSEVWNIADAIEKSLKELVGIGSSPHYTDFEAGKIWDIPAMVNKILSIRDEYKKNHGDDPVFVDDGLMVVLNSEKNFNGLSIPAMVGFRTANTDNPHRNWKYISYIQAAKLVNCFYKNKALLDELIELQIAGKIPDVFIRIDTINSNFSLRVGDRVFSL